MGTPMCVCLCIYDIRLTRHVASPVGPRRVIAVAARTKHLYMPKYIPMHVYIYAYICMPIYVCLCMPIYIYIYISDSPVGPRRVIAVASRIEYLNKPIYVYICLYVCLYMYAIYAYIYKYISASPVYPRGIIAVAARVEHPVEAQSVLEKENR